MPGSAVVKRQAGLGRSTTSLAPAVFCPFQKRYHKTGRTVQFLLSSGAKWSVNNFEQEYIIKQHTTYNFNRHDFIERHNVLMLSTE